MRESAPGNGGDPLSRTEHVARQEPEQIARQIAEQIDVEHERVLEVIARSGELKAGIQVHARGFTLQCSPRTEGVDDAAAGQMADVLERLLTKYLNLLRGAGLTVSAERTWTDEKPKEYV